MEDKRSSAVWVVVAAVFMLPVLYFGSYLALMQPGSFALGGTFTKYADYRYGGLYAARFFYPAHLLDRRIRPAYWQDDYALDSSTIDVPQFK